MLLQVKYLFNFKYLCFYTYNYLISRNIYKIKLLYANIGRKPT